MKENMISKDIVLPFHLLFWCAEGLKKCVSSRKVII